MTPTQTRRSILKELLRTGHAGTQSELCEALRHRGYPATQSTISRDLKRIGATRATRSDGSYTYHLSPGFGVTLLREMIVGIESNEVVIVVKTHSGRAQAVGSDIDALQHPDILGTLAGDDTVLVIPRRVSDLEALARGLDEVRRPQSVRA
jgi:transcriptional regulator of arginine metabolism